MPQMIQQRNVAYCYANYNGLDSEPNKIFRPIRMFLWDHYVRYQKLAANATKILPSATNTHLKYIACGGGATYKSCSRPRYLRPEVCYADALAGRYDKNIEGLTNIHQRTFPWEFNSWWTKLGFRLVCRSAIMLSLLVSPLINLQAHTTRL